MVLCSLISSDHSDFVTLKVTLCHVKVTMEEGRRILGGGGNAKHNVIKRRRDL